MDEQLYFQVLKNRNQYIKLLEQKIIRLENEISRLKIKETLHNNYISNKSLDCVAENKCKITTYT